MKTKMNRTKLAVLSLGFIFLTSCTGDVTGGTAFWKIQQVSEFSTERIKNAENQQTNFRLLVFCRFLLAP